MYYIYVYIYIYSVHTPGCVSNVKQRQTLIVESYCIPSQVLAIYLQYAPLTGTNGLSANKDLFVCIWIGMVPSIGISTLVLIALNSVYLHSCGWRFYSSKSSRKPLEIAGKV